MLENRLTQVLVGFGVLNLLVIGHLVRLQVVEQRKWEAKGEDNRSRRRFTLPLRGSIRLRDGTVVARSEHRYELRMEPRAFRDEWLPGALTMVRRKLEDKRGFWFALGTELGPLAELAAKAEPEPPEEPDPKRESARDASTEAEKEKSPAQKAKEELAERIESRWRIEAGRRAKELREIVDDPAEAWRRLMATPVFRFLPMQESEAPGGDARPGPWEECHLDGRIGAQLDAVLGPRTLARLRAFVREGGPRDRWRPLGEALGLAHTEAGEDRYRELEAEARAFGAVRSAVGGDVEERLWTEAVHAEDNARSQLIAIDQVAAKESGAPPDPGWWIGPLAGLDRERRARYRTVVRDHLGRARFPFRVLPYEAVVELDRADFADRLTGLEVRQYSGRRLVHPIAPHVVGHTGSVLRRWVKDLEVKVPVDLHDLWFALNGTRAVSRHNIEGQQRRIVSQGGMRDRLDARAFLALETALLEKPHAGDRDVGAAGIELWYDRRLRGARGIRRYVHVPGEKRPIIINETLPVDGRDVTLTLDADLQAKAEELLERDRRSRRGEGEYAGKGGGALVALDPRSGEILVLATNPSYDPRTLNKKGEYERLDDENGSKPLRNRALEPGMPGSVFKVFTALAGMGAGVFQPIDQFVCWGKTGMRPRCGNHMSVLPPGEPVDLRRALGLSCNAYFAQIGRRIYRAGKAAAFEALFDRLHLRSIPLYGDRKAWHKGHSEPATSDWMMRTMAIGQHPVRVSPLQVAGLYALIARRGLWKEPHIVRESPFADRLEVQLIPPEQAEALIPGLKYTVQEGTASHNQRAREFWKRIKERSRKDGHEIAIAGKTGTATHESRDGRALKPKHAWFACFAPVKDPEIVVVVYLEHRGQGGGAAAVPIGAEFLCCYVDHRDGFGQKKAVKE